MLASLLVAGAVACRPGPSTTPVVRAIAVEAGPPVPVAPPQPVGVGVVRDGPLLPAREATVPRPVVHAELPAAWVEAWR